MEADILGGSLEEPFPLLCHGISEQEMHNQ